MSTSSKLPFDFIPYNGENMNLSNSWRAQLRISTAPNQAKLCCTHSSSLSHQHLFQYTEGTRCHKISFLVFNQSIVFSSKFDIFTLQYPHRATVYLLVPLSPSLSYSTPTVYLLVSVEGVMAVSLGAVEVSPLLVLRRDRLDAPLPVHALEHRTLNESINNHTTVPFLWLR